MKQFSTYCLLVLFALALTTMGCDSDQPIGNSFADENYVARGAVVTPANVQTGFFNLTNPTESDIAFDLTSRGEVVTSTEVLVSLNNGGEFLLTTVPSLPATLTVSMTDVLAALQKPVDSIKVGNVVSFLFDAKTSSGEFRSSKTLNVPFSCLSELAGTYDYEAYSNFCGGAASAGTITFNEVGAGLYTLSDWSFGSYVACYGGPAASYGSLQLSDVCSTLSIRGVDSYGDSWSWIIKSVNGPVLDIGWENTYGENGGVRIIRPDGSDWPDLTIE